MPVIEQRHFILKRIIPLGLLLLLAAWFHPYWKAVDQTYNDYWRTHIAVQGNPDPSILIVEIDDQSLTAMEPLIGRWPWPRSVHGFVLEGILPAKPQAVIFDILFSEADIYRPDDDAFFIEDILSH